MRLIPVLCACILALSVNGSAHAATHEQLTQQVRDAENGFAATMAKRDYKAFASFIADDAVFFDRENTAFRTQQRAGVQPDGRAGGHLQFGLAARE